MIVNLAELTGGELNRVVNGIARSLAAVGKKVVSWDDDGECISVKACSTLRAAPCPACLSGPAA